MHLHCGTDTLPADTDAGLVAGHIARGGIHLDADLAILGEMEAAPDQGHELGQVVGRQECRRATAPVDLHDLAAIGAERGGGHLHLAGEERAVTPAPLADRAGRT